MKTPGAQSLPPSKESESLFLSADCESFVSYVMALFTLAGIFVVVYFPFPIQQEEIALNIEYELGQTNNFVPFRSIFGYIKDFFSGYQSVFLFQCIGNILLFVPYGFLLRF